MEQIQESTQEKIADNMSLVMKALGTAQTPGRKSIFESEKRSEYELLVQLKKTMSQRATEKRRAYKFANAAFEMHQVLKSVTDILKTARHRLTVQEYTELKLKLSEFGIEF